MVLIVGPRRTAGAVRRLDRVADRKDPRHPGVLLFIVTRIWINYPLGLLSTAIRSARITREDAEVTTDTTLPRSGGVRSPRLTAARERIYAAVSRVNDPSQNGMYIVSARTDP